MNTIKRDVYVLRDAIKIPIEVTKGTDAITFEFTIRDYNLPATAAAVVYAYHRTMAKPNSILCDVSGNVISFQPEEDFFKVGMNELQIRVINEEKSLISFKEKVKCSDSIGFPDDEEEKQKTLIEQLVSHYGKETGERKMADAAEKAERQEADATEKAERQEADATEKAERQAADAAEKAERQAEINVERERINNLTKLGEGSTTGDAELADIRVGANGKTYDNAGEAVRSQVSELKEDLSDFKDLADFADSNADSKDTIYIVDTNGKIIAKVSKDGIDTVGYKKHGEDFVPGSVDLLETYDDALYVADGNGNVIFKASKDGIEGININASSPSPHKDKVLISIGDSLSAHDKWQKWLVEWWGCKFDADANVNGKDGHSPMAKGGTAVIPNATDSIYIRALDAHYYNPDLIILYAGQNDVPHFGNNTDVNSSAVGTINDIPYRKTVPYTELPTSEYADYTSWYEGRPTLYSYCMGLVENLLTSCPKAQIIVVTPMQMWTSDGTQSVGRKQLVITWHDICEKYALPIVDLWNESGVNSFNMEAYYPNAGNVHPSDYGYKRIAETIYSKM